MAQLRILNWYASYELKTLSQRFKNVYSSCKPVWCTGMISKKLQQLYILISKFWSQENGEGEHILMYLYIVNIFDFLILLEQCINVNKKL